MILAELRRFVEAAELAKESEEAARSLVKGNPEEPEYLSLLGGLQSAGCEGPPREGNAEDAEAMAREAVASLELIVARSAAPPDGSNRPGASPASCNPRPSSSSARPRRRLAAIEKTDGELEALGTKFPDLRAIAGDPARSPAASSGSPCPPRIGRRKPRPRLGAAKLSATSLAAKLPAIPAYQAQAAEASRDLAVVLASRKKTKEAISAYDPPWHTWPRRSSDAPNRRSIPNAWRCIAPSGRSSGPTAGGDRTAIAPRVAARRLYPRPCRAL